MSERLLEAVTIDGPCGVGKSTVSRGLAARLGYTYLDTGAMYRAVACNCRKAGVAVDDEASVALLLKSLDIKLLPPEDGGDDVGVLLDGDNVSASIRTPEIGMLASSVSALPVVRKKLTGMQQEMGAAGKVVAEGRDTGTVVFPSAAWKFYLDAKPQERARRRIKQLREKGREVDEQKLLDQIIKRDRDDRERTIAPLKAAPDAILIDATNIDAGSVIEKMLSHISHHPI